MDPSVSFGSWIRLRRKILDLTQDALARAVGCSVVTIRKLESDERRPSRQIAERLADSLQILAQERAAFIGLARAEPSIEAAAQAPPLPEVAPQRSRTNLPIPLTRLIGRRGEVSALRGALLRADTRLVTLSGPPGIGKTRLALQVAGELRDAFADGVWFVALAPVTDHTLVLPAVAAALGLREQPGRPLSDHLHDYLREKRLLLLLDNCEHVLEASPDIVELLETGAGLKALVTSRAQLRVRGEQVVLVAPLPLPDGEQASSFRQLAQNPAVALFVERARAARPAFALTEANAAEIATLCAHLDGLPLAIELLAARIRMAMPAMLLDGIGQRLALLADGPRDLPVRHQTLRAALAGSYDLLRSDAQALFRQLGVFAGSWTLEATEVLWSHVEHDGETLLLQPLTTLVEHSLVIQSPMTDSIPRFTMLETIREYARERLAAEGEEAGARHVHAAHFLELAERAAPELQGPRQVAWLDRLEADYPDLRAALEWVIQSADSERALRLAGSLGWFWFVRGRSSEGRRWLDQAIAVAHTQPVAGAPAEKSRLATALQAAGHLALFQGDFRVARAYLEAGVANWRELAQEAPAQQPIQQGLAFSLTFLFLTTQFQGDMAARDLLLSEYLALSATLDDPRSRALVLFNLGRGALLQQGDYQNARAQLEACLALLRPLGDLWYIAQVVIDLGLVALFQEAYQSAEAWYREGLELGHALRDRTLVALALNNLGEAARCQGNTELAAHYYTESLALHQELGNRSEAPRLLHNLGYIALHQGDITRASSSFQDSLRQFQQLGMARGIAENLAGLAAILAIQAQPEAAARLWGAAEALHESEATPTWPADRREHLRYQAIARSQLDPASWEAAWRQGRANPQRQLNDVSSLFS
jgi:predicted ATPase/transcriptional regulator with XRE-family HTH domain